VLNEGISGARVLRDRMGDNALARFDRDVLSHPEADTVVLMMGINDVGWPDTILVPKGEPAPSAEDVIDGYEQIVARRPRARAANHWRHADSIRGDVPRHPALRLL
jgi:lysophospholipase L1-like esterase